MSETARLVISVDSRQVQQADRAMGALIRTSSAVTSAVAAVTAGFGVREIYQAAEAYQTITNRMKLVTSSAVELAAAQSAVFGIAQKSGQSLSATAELYQRIAQNQDALKLSGEGVAGIVDTISKAMVISGASASSAQAALIQLGQAFASGTLRGEELNSVMEQAPALSQAIAKGMGKTVGELRAMGAEGKLTADAVVQALQSQAGAVDDLFGKMQDTMGTGLTRIGNSFTKLVGKMNEVSGVSASIAGSFTTVSAAVDSLTEDADSLAATVATVGAVMSGVAAGGAVLLADKLMVSVVASRAARAANIAQAESALQNAIANQRAAQTAVVRATAEAQAARGTAVQTQMSIQLAQARMREAAATATVTSAQAALTTASRGMLAVLGGPVGLALLAAGAAASYFLFRDATEEVQRSTLDLSAPLDQLTDKWLALGDAQRAAVGNDLRLKIDESKQSIISLSDEVEAAFYDLGNTKGLPVEAWLAPMREFRKAALDGGESIHDFAQALTDGHPAGSDFRVMVEALAAKIESERDSALKAAEGLKILENQTRANTSANQDLAGSTDSVGQKFLASLQRRADFAGQLTELQKVNISIEKGYAGVLSETDIALARSNASLIDRANATNGVTKATNEQANAYQALYDRLYPAEAAQRQYNKELGLLSDRLSGDKLADAVHRLNFAIEGADATGPGDVIEDYRKELQRLEDQLDPVGKATSQYQKDVERLNDAMERGERSPERTTELLAELERQYKDNTKATSEWAQWTEGALDRVDGAFADAWRNIGDGFSSFRDSLTDAFKQMLAELAHMAITKPIIMQIGASMGIGSGTQGNNGIWGSLLGGGSAGGINYGQLASYGQSAYSALTGWGQAAYTGWQNGGVTGAYNGVTGYYGDLMSGAYNTVSGALGYGNGANIAGYTGQAYANWAAGGSQAIGASQAGYTGAQYSAWVGQQNAAATAGTYAPWASAAAGAYMGYQNSGAKGAVAGGLGGWGGAKAGATMGSYFGPIGTAVGAVIGGILGSTLGSKVFGGDWQTKSAGLALGVEGGDFLGQSYEYQKKDGGLFGSTKRRYKYSALDGETAAQFQSAFDATEDTVASVFEQLSLTVEEGSLAGLQLAREKISTSGKTEEEISQAISEWFGTAAEAMNTELNKVFATGLDYDLAGMQAFVGNLLGVNETLRYLDVDMYDASVAGGKLAEALSAAAGGLEALATNSQTYYSAFFSEAEKIEDTIDSIKRTFESADVELAASREAYRAMVEDIDLTTEAGREMFATLMELSGQAAQYYSILEQQAAQAYATLQANVAVYYEQFTTAGEKADDMLASVTASFEALELALPSSRDGFRAVVDGLDTSTEAGQRMFQTLMSVAGAADAYYDILESRAAEAQAAAEAAAQAQAAAAEAAARAQAELLANTANAAMAASSGAISALSKAIDAEKSAVTSAYQSQADAIEAAMDRASEAVSDMRGVADTLRSAVNGLRLESDQYNAQSRRNAQTLIGQTLSSGGRVQMTAQLERALDTVSESSEDLFGSFEDYARDYWQTYFAIESLADKAEDQLTAEERTVKALEGQLDQAQRYHEAELERLDGMVDGAQAQLDALLGINTGVLSVEAALAVVASSIGALKQLQNANSSITSVTGLGGVKRQVNSEGYVLNEIGDVMTLFGEAMRVVGNKVIGGMGASLNIGADGQLSWAEGDYEKWAKQEGIPGFASGGSHRGGLRLVGENGPELEVTGPSRIYNASQTAAMLGGGGDAAAEVRGLRADFGGMMSALRSVAKHTMQTAKRVEFLERWDFDGLPKERATA